MILLAIDDYHQKTPIRFKQYDPTTDTDYVHITGEDSGSWSYVGRIGVVSSRVQGVVKTSPALRTAPLGYYNFRPPHPKQIQIQTHYGLSRFKPPPHTHNVTNSAAVHCCL